MKEKLKSGSELAIHRCAVLHQTQKSQTREVKMSNNQCNTILILYFK